MSLTHNYPQNINLASVVATFVHRLKVSDIITHNSNIDPNTSLDDDVLHGAIIRTVNAKWGDAGIASSDGVVWHKGTHDPSSKHLNFTVLGVGKYIIGFRFNNQPMNDCVLHGGVSLNDLANEYDKDDRYYQPFNQLFVVDTQAFAKAFPSLYTLVQGDFLDLFAHFGLPCIDDLGSFNHIDYLELAIRADYLLQWGVQFYTPEQLGFGVDVRLGLDVVGLNERFKSIKKVQGDCQGVALIDFLLMHNVYDDYFAPPVNRSSTLGDDLKDWLDY